MSRTPQNPEKTKRPGRPTRYTPAEIIAACEGSRGVLAVVARKLGCNRETVEKAVERWPEVAAALKGAKEHVVDLLEIKIYDKAIKEGDITALKYLLNTHGKARGYGAKPEPETQVVEIVVDIGGD